MTEGEKRCGLGSFIPMACRGRAEAFARRLHSRLRSLGSQDSGGGNGGGGIDNGIESENSWLTKNEISTTSIQPKQNATSTNSSDLFMDFSVFETPGSPEEEITESDLSKLITNQTDDLHLMANLDECNCMAAPISKHKRNSIDSDSSDGLYFDPENTDLETTCLMFNNTSQVNGFTSPKQPSEFPSSSSNSTAQEPPTHVPEHSERVSPKPKPVVQQQTPPWKLSYEYKTNNNNNIFSAIDLESLKSSNTCNGTATNDAESYCSHFDLEQNFTVECPTNFGADVLGVPEISTFEIRDLDDIEAKESSKTSENSNTCSLQNDQETPSETETSLNVNEQLDEINQKKDTTSNYLQVQNDVTPVQVKEDIIADTETEEERIPRVRRCSSLKTGKTPPGTPGRKKIVRFADVLGLDLADVRTFMDEIPKIPTSAYDDLSLSLSDTSLNSSSLQTNRPSKTLVPLFQQPGGETNFLDRVREQQVCLENAVLHDPVDMCVCGTVRVRNLDFNKSVHIRYTLDSWKTYADLQATYVTNSCDGFSDKFSFTLYVHTLNIGQKLEFAVRFQCKGCQYWDSNGGQNYCFHCLPTCNNNTTQYLSGTPDDTHWAGAAFYYKVDGKVRMHSSDGKNSDIKNCDAISLQRTVQEYVTQNLSPKSSPNHSQLSRQMVMALVIALFAFGFGALFLLRIPTSMG